MDGRIVQTSCRTAQFSAVEAALREWPEVEAVGSFREKKNNKEDITTVFVTFRDDEAAKAAKAKLEVIPGVAGAATALSGSPEHTRTTGRGRGKRSQKKGGAISKKKNVAAEFLSFESYGDQKRRDGRTNENVSGAPGEGSADVMLRGRGGRGGRRGGNTGNTTTNNKNNNESGRGAGGSRGGMRGRGRTYQLPPQGFPQPLLSQPPVQPPLSQPPPLLQQPPYQPPPRFPSFEANVAFIDNIPFGTPNKYLMDKFSPFGRILDVNRFDVMVMICFDNPEAVQQCIQHMNGTSIHGNVITVSSGTVRIPGSVAIRMGI